MAAWKLLEVPQDIQNFIRQKQGEIKSKKHVGCYSIDKVIYQIITEHPDYSKEKKVKKDNE